MRREDLRAIEGMTDDQVEAVMRLHGQDEQAHQQAMQQMQTQLDTAREGLKAFKGVDVPGLQQQVKDLTDKMEQQSAAFAFDTDLRKAAREAHARSEDDVIALLPDKDKLQASKNRSADLAAAMAGLQQAKPYLFEAVDTQQQSQQGGQPGQPDVPPIVVGRPRPQGGSQEPTLTEFLKMSGAERIALRTRNPALFQQLSDDVRSKRSW